MSCAAIHDLPMRRAIGVSKTNPRHPFGSVIFDRVAGDVVAHGINQSGSNPVLHGEIDAINSYAASGAAKWQRLVLYTTAEPCPMCMSAILWAGITTVVYGTSIPTLVQFGWNQIDIRAGEIVAKSHRPECELVGGMLERECDMLFRSSLRGADKK